MGKVEALDIYNRGPELYHSEDEVPLQHGEKARMLLVETSLDGGVLDLSFYVPLGKNFPPRILDRTNGAEICLSNAWINSREYDEFFQQKMAKINDQT